MTIIKSSLKEEIAFGLRKHLVYGNMIWRYSKAFGSDTFGFDMYKIPERSSTFGTISPVSLDFDSKGNVYFVGIHSRVLWFGNVTKKIK